MRRDERKNQDLDDGRKRDRSRERVSTVTRANKIVRLADSSSGEKGERTSSSGVESRWEEGSRKRGEAPVSRDRDGAGDANTSNRLKNEHRREFSRRRDSSGQEENATMIERGREINRCDHKERGKEPSDRDCEGDPDTSNRFKKGRVGVSGRSGKDGKDISGGDHKGRGNESSESFPRLRDGRDFDGSSDLRGQRGGIAIDSDRRGSGRFDDKVGSKGVGGAGGPDDRYDRSRDPSFREHSSSNQQFSRHEVGTFEDFGQFQKTEWHHGHSHGHPQPHFFEQAFDPGHFPGQFPFPPMGGPMGAPPMPPHAFPPGMFPPAFRPPFGHPPPRGQLPGQGFLPPPFPFYPPPPGPHQHFFPGPNGPGRPDGGPSPPVPSMPSQMRVPEQGASDITRGPSSSVHATTTNPSLSEAPTAVSAVAGNRQFDGDGSGSGEADSHFRQNLKQKLLEEDTEEACKVAEAVDYDSKRDGSNTTVEGRDEESSDKPQATHEITEAASTESSPPRVRWALETGDVLVSRRLAGDELYWHVLAMRYPHLYSQPAHTQDYTTEQYNYDSATGALSSDGEAEAPGVDNYDISHEDGATLAEERESSKAGTIASFDALFASLGQAQQSTTGPPSSIDNFLSSATMSADGVAVAPDNADVDSFYSMFGGTIDAVSESAAVADAEDDAEEEHEDEGEDMDMDLYGDIGDGDDGGDDIDATEEARQNGNVNGDSVRPATAWANQLDVLGTGQQVSLSAEGKIVTAGEDEQNPLKKPSSGDNNQSADQTSYTGVKWFNCREFCERVLLAPDARRGCVDVKTASNITLPYHVQNRSYARMVAVAKASRGQGHSAHFLQMKKEIQQLFA